MRISTFFVFGPFYEDFDLLRFFGLFRFIVIQYRISEVMRRKHLFGVFIWPMDHYFESMDSLSEQRRGFSGLVGARGRQQSFNDDRTPSPSEAARSDLSPQSDDFVVVKVGTVRSDQILGIIRIMSLFVKLIESEKPGVGRVGGGAIPVVDSALG